MVEHLVLTGEGFNGGGDPFGPIVVVIVPLPRGLAGLAGFGDLPARPVRTNSH